jgi:hypothetical protein
LPPFFKGVEMAIEHAIVGLTTTATLLTVAASGGGKDGSTILIQNPAGGQVVYLGGAGVTSSVYGFILAVDANISLELNQDEALYGVVATSTQSVAVLRQGV